MAKYVSGKFKNLQVGIKGYSEDKLALNIVGIVSAASYQSGSSGITSTGATFENLNISGVSTFIKDANFSENVSIGGTLTYEDVTNIDSVGLITARSGLRINDGGLIVTAGVSTFAGITTVTGDTLFAKNTNFSGITTINHIHILQQLNHVTIGPGVSTFTGDLHVYGDLYPQGNVVGDSSTNISGVYDVQIENELNVLGDIVSSNSNIIGVNSVTATTFYGDGLNLTGVTTIGDAGTWDELVPPSGQNYGLNNFRAGDFAGPTLGNYGYYGERNIAIGHSAFGQNNFASSYNVIIGHESGYFTTSNKNTFVGYRAGKNSGQGGDNNTIIGADLDLPLIGGSNQFVIGCGSINIVGVLDKIGIGTTNPQEKLHVVGVVSATSFYGDGSALTGVISGVGIQTASGNVGYAVTYLKFVGDGVGEITAPVTGISTINITGAATTTGNIIVPFAYAHIKVEAAGVGIGMTYGAYEGTYGRQEFYFNSAQPNSDYYILSEREQYDTHSVHISNKTTSGFRATWLDNSGTGPLSPSTFPGVLIAYGSDPKTAASIFDTGISTVGTQQFTNLDLSGFLDVDGHTELDNLNVSGVVTATSFSGDGSNLTGVTAASGVSIKDGGSTVGTASTIDFGTNLSVSALSAGIVTVTASGGGGGASGLWESNSTGINTSTNVAIGNTNASDAAFTIDVGTAVTAFNVVGSEGSLFSVTNNLSTGSIFSVNDISGIPSFDVDADGTVQIAPFGVNEKVGIGTTNPQAKLHVVGVVSATSFYGDGSGLDGVGVGTGTSVNTTGIITASAFHGNGANLTNSPWDEIPYDAASGSKNLKAGNFASPTLSVDSGNYGERNISIGRSAMSGGDWQSFDNIVIGSDVGQGTFAQYASIGDRNILLGTESGKILNNSNDNIFIGYKAGDNATSNANSNIVIGSNVDLPVVGGDDQLVIGVGNTHWITGLNGDIGIGTDDPKFKTHIVGSGSTTLMVEGNARITGILTIGQSSITLDPSSRKLTGLDEVELGQGVNKVILKKTAKGYMEFVDSNNRDARVAIGTDTNIKTVGVVTATRFVGDGSGLTGITATGSGIGIKDSGSVVGTATTIDFGTNLNVSPVTAGIVTVSSTSFTTGKAIAMSMIFG